MIFKFTINKFSTAGEGSNYYVADFEVYIKDKNLRNAKKQLTPLFSILEKNGYYKEPYDTGLIQYVKKYGTWMRGYNISYGIERSLNDCSGSDRY